MATHIFALPMTMRGFVYMCAVVVVLEVPTIGDDGGRRWRWGGEVDEGKRDVYSVCVCVFECDYQAFWVRVCPGFSLDSVCVCFCVSALCLYVCVHVLYVYAFAVGVKSQIELLRRHEMGGVGVAHTHTPLKNTRPIATLLLRFLFLVLFTRSAHTRTHAHANTTIWMEEWCSQIVCVVARKTSALLVVRERATGFNGVVGGASRSVCRIGSVALLQRV